MTSFIRHKLVRAVVYKSPVPRCTELSQTMQHRIRRHLPCLAGPSMQTFIPQSSTLGPHLISNPRSLWTPAPHSFGHLKLDWHASTGSSPSLSFIPTCLLTTNLPLSVQLLFPFPHPQIVQVSESCQCFWHIFPSFLFPVHRSDCYLLSTSMAI